MIKTEIRLPIEYGSDAVKEAVCAFLPIEPSEIKSIDILKKALKLEGEKPEYSLTVGLELSAEREKGLLKMKKKVGEYPDLSLNIPKANLTSRPVVVGAGPAGLFASLILAEAGARPIVLERGLPVEERQKCVSAFLSGACIDNESNIQFGEGGAGAFSDGKLKVGGIDKYKRRVLEEFVLAGAPEDIVYLVGAHLGTDKLPGIVSALREKIKSLGAEFHYSSKLTDIDVKDGKICGCKYIYGGKEEYIPTEYVILAAGHSATDVFEMLLKNGAVLQSRGFGIGMRIEHPREYINKLIYGDPTLCEKVGTASYHLVSHLDNGRSVYSFCMCPVGVVVPAASEKDGIVTNGMSPYARNEDNSNSALLVSITPKDFGTDSPLGGVYMQREIERRAFALSGGFSAPAVKLSDFLGDKEPKGYGEVQPSYARGTYPMRPEKYLPEYVCESLKGGILEFDKWLRGFYYEDAVLTGPETRSTSPVRVLRNEKFSSVNIFGLYPAGEGAGYGGGIVSSAYDGIKCAESIILESIKG